MSFRKKIQYGLVFAKYRVSEKFLCTSERMVKHCAGKG
jgi:hypothetical protein